MNEYKASCKSAFTLIHKTKTDAKLIYLWHLPNINSYIWCCMRQSFVRWVCSSHQIKNKSSSSNFLFWLLQSEQIQISSAKKCFGFNVAQWSKPVVENGLIFILVELAIISRCKIELRAIKYVSFNIHFHW